MVHFFQALAQWIDAKSCMKSTSRASLKGAFDAVYVAQQRPIREEPQDGRAGIHHPSDSEIPREVDLGLVDDLISANVVVAVDEISLANSWLQHGLLL